jgi:DNA mismatch repair ATPase MutS
MHIELLRLVGSLNYRTSHRQNQYYHTLEVARLAGMPPSVVMRAREILLGLEDAGRLPVNDKVPIADLSMIQKKTTSPIAKDKATKIDTKGGPGPELDLFS